MKKFIVISLFMLICISSLFAQDVMTQYWAGDASYNFHQFIDPLGANAPDGWLLEIYVSEDGVIDGLDPATRLPLGDDLLAVNQVNGYFSDYLNGSTMTGGAGQWYAAGLVVFGDPVAGYPEPVLNWGDNFYIVLYNSADPLEGGATHYCTSGMLTSPPAPGGPYDIGIEVWYDDAWIPFGPIPVTLADFSTAVFVNEFVEISWTTESSVNMSLWNLHRENQGTNLIINTQPAVNTSETYHYNFQDEEVVNGETYTYYLEAVDYDGTTFMYGPVSATMLEEEVPELPNQTELFGNHPNPFNPATFINFNVKEDESATLTIFNTKGQVVVSRTFEAGFYNYNWQADSNPSGVYFYKLQSDSHTSVKKMLLLK